MSSSLLKVKIAGCALIEQAISPEDPDRRWHLPVSKLVAGALRLSENSHACDRVAVCRCAPPSVRGIHRDYV